MKRIALLIATMASIILLMACSNEIDDFDNKIEDNRIILNMSDAVVQTYSDAIPSECMIDKLWVLEFNGSGALVNDTLINGSAILGNGTARQLLPQLPFKPANGNKVVLIANTDAKTFPHPDKASITYSKINTYFTLDIDDYFIVGEFLPMYGEIVWPSAYTCEMVRAVAKIQMQMGTNPSDITGNFNPENITYKIYNCAVGGYIQQPTPLTGIAKTVSGFIYTLDFYLLQKENVAEQEKTLYLFEFPSSTTEGMGNLVGNTFNAQRQFILITKTFNAVTTYYRMDFYDPITKRFLDTRRNHHYIFTIHNVHSEGYTSQNAAILNPGSNIEYTVEVKDGSSHITSNGQFAIVTSVDTAYVDASAAPFNATVATARCQLPTEMSVVTGAASSILLVDVTPAGSAALVSPTTLTYTNAPVVVKIISPTFTSARVKFTFGNITHYVVITN
jgi:hypothetical protein